jgi:hypothetical protein
MLCMHGFSRLPADDLINEMAMDGSGSRAGVCVSAARIDNNNVRSQTYPLQERGEAIAPKL